MLRSISNGSTQNADKVIQRDGIETFMLKGKAVHVLAEGRLVNLATPKGMGHPIEVMDLSLRPAGALHPPYRKERQEDEGRCIRCPAGD